MRLRSQNCCEARICPGQSFSWGKSVRFKFQDGETFKLGTSELGDNDHVGDAQGALQPIGSFNKEFPFSLTLQDTFTQPVGSGDCKITINYTFTKGK